MVNVIFSETGARLTESRIKNLEQQLGCTLPKDYRKFLLKYNGGKPSPAFFQVGGDHSFPSWVVEFHSVDENLAEPNEDAEPGTLSFNHFKFGEWIPEDCLIIGTVVRDDWLLLRIRGKQRGTIELKTLPEIEVPFDIAEWSKKKDEGIEPVAKSFSEFLKMLKDEAG